MLIKLLQFYELDVDLPPELADLYEVPDDLYVFQRTLLPVLIEVVAKHPHPRPADTYPRVSNDPSPSEIAWHFLQHMKYIQVMKNPLKQWQSTADVLADIPRRDRPRWQKYDPVVEKVPYAVWYLVNFAGFV
jgi:hypothetical protein